MNKQRYIALLKDPSGITKSDIPDIEELIEQFPYCQNAHILLAKIQTEVGSMHAAKLTRKAALYTSDRTKLKQLLEPQQEFHPSTIEATASRLLDEKISTAEAENTTSISTETPVMPDSITEKVDSVIQKVETVPPVNIKHEAEKHATNFLHELEENLKALREAKARAAGILQPFSKEEVEAINKKIDPTPIITEEPSVIENKLVENILSENTTESIVQKDAPPVAPISETTISPEKPKRPFSALIDAEVPPKKDPIQRNDILDLILSFDNRVKDYFDINQYTSKEKNEDSTDITETSGDRITNDYTLPFNNNDWKLEESRLEEPGQPNSESLLLNYLEYLQEQKNKKQKPDKKREKSIISRFIQKDPAISPLSASEASSEDDDNSGENPQSQSKPIFISETFAQLLEKQGKIEKAIGVYEELILKNPEKNSYFATRIQELKKKL